MPTFNVFLDSNVFINAKYDFNRASLQNLMNYCNDGIVTMFTNDIIAREVKHHINTDIKLLAQQAKNSIKNHGELINALSQQEFESIKSKLLAVPTQLEAAFSSFLSNATYIPNTGLSIVDLFNDYFECNAPFEGGKEKKSEFPDAAVIMSIKNYSTEKSISLHIVTNDNGWHNAFVNVPNVFMYNDITAVLTRISKEQDELFKQITSFINTKIQSLQEDAQDWLLDQDWDFAIDENETCVELDVISDVNIEDLKLILDGIEYIDVKNGYAMTTLTGKAEVKIDFSYIDHTNEIYDREDHTWYNTIYGNGIALIKAPLSLSVRVILPDDADDELEIDSIDFENLDERNTETIDCKLVEDNADIREPYYDICPDCGEKIGLHNDSGTGFCINCAPRH